MRMRRRFEFVMGKTARPDVSTASERMQVCAEYARVRLAFGGVLEAALSGVTSTAYRVRATSHRLHVLLLFSAKYLIAR